MHLPAFVAMDILSNETNDRATVRLPASGFAEKRGSMINGKGRLQRLNRATRPPGNARDDWEILRDLLQGLGGGNGIYTIEDVFRQMSTEIHQFHGLTLSKIGDLGVHVIKEDESPRPPRDPRRETSSVRRKNAHPDDKIDNGLRFHRHIVPENCWPARVRAWPDELRRLRRAPRQRVDARSARSESRRVRRLAPTNRRRRKIFTQRTIHAR